MLTSEIYVDALLCFSESEYRVGIRESIMTKYNNINVFLIVWFSKSDLRDSHHIKDLLKTEVGSESKVANRKI